MLKRPIGKFFKNRHGFTLAELMIVVVIIGILTAIAIPVYNISKGKAEERACQANLRMIDSAMEQYKFDNGKAPSSINDLKGYFSNNEIPECPTGGEYSISNGIAKCPNNHSYRNSNTGSTGSSDNGNGGN